jgi:hypothetical protein
MAQELINIGDLPNDGKGDSIRIAFTKINNNFTEVFNTLNANSTDGTESLSNTIVYTSSSTDPNQTLDRLDSRVYNTARYLIEATTNEHIQIEELLLMHNVSEVRYVRYGQMTSGPLLANFSGRLIGNEFRLTTSPQFDLVSFKVLRTVIPLMENNLVTLASDRPNQLVDINDATVNKSVKYIIESRFGNQCQVEEILVMHNSVDAYIMSYATLNSAPFVIARYSAVLENNLLKLTGTPTYPGVKVKFTKTVI